MLIRNKFLKKYIQIPNLLASLLIIYFILSINGCLDFFSGPGITSSVNCGYGASKSMQVYPFNEQDPPSETWLGGNVRYYSYRLGVGDVCSYENVNGSIEVIVDTSTVSEGLTVFGKAKGSGSYENEFNTSLIHNYYNTGQSKFRGSIIVDLIDSFSPTYCSIYAIIQFPTKGSEQQDLNYLYSKVFEVYIGIGYYKII